MKAEYNYNRLCFKANVIESLKEYDIFVVHTPKGRFQMTKSDFYRVFTNVIKSRSYQEAGIYHYPTIPSKALQFFIEEK